MPRNISHINSPSFTSALIILRYDIMFYIYSKHLKKGSQFKGNPKLFCNIFFSFFDSKLNSMGGVRCSATVSEWLNMRKSLGIYYYQDTISGAEVKNNVININKL